MLLDILLVSTTSMLGFFFFFFFLNEISVKSIEIDYIIIFNQIWINFSKENKHQSKYHLPKKQVVMVLNKVIQSKPCRS